MPNVRKYFQSVLSAHDFPGEILTGVPVIEIKGEAETEVIHHRGVLCYDENIIRIASSAGQIVVRGENLTISRMNRERMVIRGKVRSVQIGEEKQC